MLSQNQKTVAAESSTHEKSYRVPLREYQLYEIEIFKEFKRICEKHGLRYWVAYGTLLGAARHKGFIPWDDDIDVCMPAEDYLRFREVCKRSLGADYYLQVHCDNPCNYISWQRIGVKNSTSLLLSHADIHAEWGVCIDIFPYVPCADAESSSFKQQVELLKRFDKASRKYLYKHDAKGLSGAKRAYHLLMAAESDKKNVRRWLSLEKKIFDLESVGYTGYFDTTWPSIIYDARWFEETVYLSFEGMSVPAPAGYKEVLSAYYGEDWHEMPPEEKRVCHGGGGSDSVVVSLTEPYERFLR